MANKEKKNILVKEGRGEGGEGGEGGKWEARTTDRKVAHCTLRVKVMMMKTMMATMMTTKIRTENENVMIINFQLITMVMVVEKMMVMVMVVEMKEFNTGTTQATPSCVKKYSRP